MTDTIDAISCAYLECIFDFCRSRSIHLQRIINGIPYPLERLADQTQTIPWNTFFDLVAQTGKFFDEDNFRTITDPSLDAIFTLGRDDKIIAANPAACTTFGYQSPELVGMSITDLMPRPLESSNYGIRRDRSAFPLQAINSPKNLGKSTYRFYVLRGIASSTQLQKEK
jgi:PAS domain S-box-containing protein